MNDSLGDKCKAFEKNETESHFLWGLPLYARLDGRGFSKLTKKLGLKKPYDEWMSALMIDTMHFLVEEFNATCGYTQSDEISLAWVDSVHPFNGKKHKVISSLAAAASAFFSLQMKDSLYDKDITSPPTFDCRAFVLPSVDDCLDQIRWREKDCMKNAISGAASQYYSHNQLLNKNSSEKQEMLFKIGINFNDYPPLYKRGTFCLRKKVLKDLTEEELSKIPEDKRPSGSIERNMVYCVSLPPLHSIINKKGVLFYGQEIYQAEQV